MSLTPKERADCVAAAQRYRLAHPPTGGASARELNSDGPPKGSTPWGHSQSIEAIRARIYRAGGKLR